MKYSDKEKKKLKLYKLLGARQFQKFVFGIEKVKYKVMHKFFPKSLEKFNKRLDKSFAKEKLNCKSEEELEKLKTLYLIRKTNANNEWNNDQNRNYHMMMDSEKDFSIYLNWNKNIHKRALTKSIVLLGASVPVLLTPLEPFAIASIIINFIACGLNFECINLQNYNLLRYSKVKDELIRRSQKKRIEIATEYGDGIDIIPKLENSKINSVNKTNDNYDKIIKDLDIKSLLQLTNYLSKIIEEKDKQNNGPKPRRK